MKPSRVTCAALRFVRLFGSVLILAASRTHNAPAQTTVELPAARISVVRDEYGAVIRGDVRAKRIALLFTGDEFGEGAAAILDALKERKLYASFFLTGRFLRTREFEPIIARMVRAGHYVGPHSDGHLLYCSWEVRGKSLVSRDQFADDLKQNIKRLRAARVPYDRGPRLFVPPYEWYNADQVRWAKELGVTLVNFTPGSGSNRDYAREDDPKFVSSQRIYEDILAYEQRDSHGLNGFVLLLHLGSNRKDPFHPRLPALLDDLAKRGYEVVRVDELLDLSIVEH